MKIKFRIRSNIEFGHCVQQGKCLKNNAFTIHYLKNNFDYSRVGISVSSKLGCAVIRNKIKRQIREMCHTLIKFEMTNNDIVIVARNEFLKNDYHTNLSILNSLLEKMEVKK